MILQLLAVLVFLACPIHAADTPSAEAEDLTRWELRRDRAKEQRLERERQKKSHEDWQKKFQAEKGKCIALPTKTEQDACNKRLDKAERDETQLERERRQDFRKDQGKEWREYNKEVNSDKRELNEDNRVETKEARIKRLAEEAALRAKRETARDEHKTGRKTCLDLATAREQHECLGKLKDDINDDRKDLNEERKKLNQENRSEAKDLRKDHREERKEFHDTYELGSGVRERHRRMVDLKRVQRGEKRGVNEDLRDDRKADEARFKEQLSACGNAEDPAACRKKAHGDRQDQNAERRDTRKDLNQKHKDERGYVKNFESDEDAPGTNIPLIGKPRVVDPDKEGAGPGGGNIACTQEAKICPDGSSVGRVAPSCAFAACPGAAGGASDCSKVATQAEFKACRRAENKEHAGENRDERKAHRTGLDAQKDGCKDLSGPARVNCMKTVRTDDKDWKTAERQEEKGWRSDRRDEIKDFRNNRKKP